MSNSQLAGRRTTIKPIAAARSPSVSFLSSALRHVGPRLHPFAGGGAPRQVQEAGFLRLAPPEDRLREKSGAAPRQGTLFRGVSGSGVEMVVDSPFEYALLNCENDGV